MAPVAYSLEAIKQERRWELAFESIRWWDILRWSGPSLEEAGDILNKQTGFNIINAATVVPMVKFDYKKTPTSNPRLLAHSARRNRYLQWSP